MCICDSQKCKVKCNVYKVYGILSILKFLVFNGVPLYVQTALSQIKQATGAVV